MNTKAILSLVKKDFLLGLCDQPAMYCTEYNGMTAFIDVTSKVSYFEDMAHCQSLGGKMFIPETEADNDFMLNFLIEVHQADNNVQEMSYPIMPLNGILVWDDEQQTRE